MSKKAGKYEGILLCTDMDGTLAMGTSIPKRNLDAIAHFTEEGGLFTISSGRDHGYLEELGGGFCNAPFVCLNGAMIYDAKSHEVLFDKPMDFDSMRTIMYIKEHHLPCDAIYMYIGHGKDSVRIDLENFNPDQIGNEPIYKLLFIIKTPEETLAVRDELSKAFPEYQFTRSWHVGLEQLSANAGKGLCVSQLKTRFGAKKLICVGDFENDESMLLAADIAFAPQNAYTGVKALVQHIVCDVQDGAIADVIEMLPSLL